jgi:hypothetical protein
MYIVDRKGWMKEGKLNKEEEEEDMLGWRRNWLTKYLLGILSYRRIYVTMPAGDFTLEEYMLPCRRTSCHLL